MNRPGPGWCGANHAQDRGTLQPVSPTAHRTLSRDNAVGTAIAMLDAHGTDALTMRALAREMDVPVMSLYRHVPSRDDLERAIVATLVAGVEAPGMAADSWEDGIRLWAVSYRAMLRQHPNAAPLMAAFPAAAYGARAEDAEALLADLVHAGLSPRAARIHLRAALVTITGFCTTQVTADHAAAQAEDGGDAVPASAGGQYPLVAALMDDLRERRHGDEVFAAMLDAAIAGLRAAIAAARTA